MNEYPVRTEQQIALLIKSFRKAKGMTQADLATALGVTQQSTSALERNPSAASVGRLMRTLSALGVEMVLRAKTPVSVAAAVESGPEKRPDPAARSAKVKPTGLDW